MSNMSSISSHAIIKASHAYPCFCTPSRLAALRISNQQAGLPSGYDGLCKSLSPADVTARLRDGVPHTIRLNVCLWICI